MDPARPVVFPVFFFDNPVRASRGHACHPAAHGVGGTSNEPNSIHSAFPRHNLKVLTIYRPSVCYQLPNSPASSVTSHPTSSTDLRAFTLTSCLPIPASTRRLYSARKSAASLHPIPPPSLLYSFPSIRAPYHRPAKPSTSPLPFPAKRLPFSNSHIPLSRPRCPPTQRANAKHHP